MTWTKEREAMLREHTDAGRVAFGADEAAEFFDALDEARAERDAAVERAERAEAELQLNQDAMERSIDVLRDRASGHQCSYCGEIFPTAEPCTAHVRGCPRRPEAKLQASLAALEARHERLRAEAQRFLRAVQHGLSMQDGTGCALCGHATHHRPGCEASAFERWLSASPSAPPSTVTEKEPSDG